MRRPRALRDSAIATGAGGAALAFLLSGVAVLLSMLAVIRIGFAPASYEVGKGVDVAHDLVLSAAFAVVTLAVIGRIDRRERRLALAAVVAAIAFAGWVVAQALYGMSEPRGGDALVTSDVLGALAASTLVAASAAAAIAFRQAGSSPPDDQSKRDGLLAWAAVGLGISLVLSTASAIVYLDTVALSGDGNDGLRLSTIGLGVGVGGAAIAAIAFFISRRGQQRDVAQWMTRREALIAAALAVFVVAFVLTGVGNATVATASPHDGYAARLLVTGHWLEAISGWVLGACATAVAAGFIVSSRARLAPATH